MKKTLLLLPIAALAAIGFSSCSDEEEPAPVSYNTKHSISFRPAMSGLTRASEINNSNLSSIYVTAFMGDTLYFHDINFAKGTDGFFTSASDYPWPGDNTTLSFFSYAPSADELGADITINDNKVLKLENYVTPEEIADQVDFITANATGQRTTNEEAGVPLTFSHRLAQIEIRAKSDNKNYVIKAAGARIGRAETTGTFDFSTNKWTLDDWHDTSIWNTSITPVTLNGTAVSLMGSAGNAMMIPQTLTPWSPTADPDNVAREAYLSVLINITTADGVQLYPFPSDKSIDPATGQRRMYAWASIPLSGTWEQGKKYIYTLDLTEGAGNVDPDDPNPGNPVLGKPIKFTVNVEDWIDTPNSIPMTGIR